MFANFVQAADIDVVSSQAEQIAKPYYDKAQRRALEFKELYTYSDHGLHHAKTVADKSQDAANAINKVVNKNENYSEIDKVELRVAAYLHDTGMDGGDFKDYKNGNELRKDHSLNSAIHVLENRLKILALGVNVDAVALDCMLHSKSCSGVRDLTSAEQWTECFNRIDEAVVNYNAKFPQNRIYFDKSTWTDGSMVTIESAQNPGKYISIYTFKKDAMAKTAATAAALRLGDANREAAKYPYTQSGEKIKIDFDSYVRKVDTWLEEVKNAKITLTDVKGKERPLSSVSEDKNGYDRMYMTGEGNLSMDCVYNPKTKAVQERFKVLNGASFPLATQQCIEERLEELDTMKGLPVEVEIQMSVKSANKKDLKKAKKLYTRYCKLSKKRHGYPVKLELVDKK